MFPQIFGKYVLEREIAAGGMARVYLATLRGAVGFEKRLVVKQIRPELASDQAFVERFVEEAKTAVELSHPNIVPVYELGVEQGVYYIAMELCEGVTLAELLSATGPLGPGEGAYVGVEICRALDYAHRRAGIVHRDVTPRNVLVDEEGAVRLIDFGIAAPALVPGEEEPGRPEIFGSPGHMPPEQLHGRHLTPATDVFAVGVLLIEAWTGKPPFRRGTAEKSELALETAPAPLAEHDAALAPLDELISSAIALDPDRRPAGAELLARPLREFQKRADLGDIARRLGERVRETRRRARASSPQLPVDGPEVTRAIDDGVADTSTDATPPLPVTPASPTTRTFAARDDMVEWTRKLPSERPPPPASGSDDDTSPITASGPPPESRRSPAWRLPALLAAIVAVAALVGVRFLRVSPASPSRAQSAPARVAPPASAAPAPSAAAPLRASASASQPVPRAVHPVASAHPADPAQSRHHATLNLTADPPARVTVGSRGYGTTPVVGISLPPGSYPVVFQSGALGERVSARITLTAGQTRGVHADFTSASPRIILR